jgi:chromate reductase
MAKKMKILAFGASLRKGSYSMIVQNSLAALAPENVEVSGFGLEGIPIFNQDLEGSMPSRVKEFKAAIEASDAIVIVTPEYNYSVPGYLKNAIDWASRPYGSSSFDGKSAAVISISPGMLGGSRANYHLRQSFITLNIRALNKPEVIIPQVDQKIKDNVVADEKTRDLLKKMLQSLVSLASSGK